jgi:hypothetical protein
MTKTQGYRIGYAAVLMVWFSVALLLHAQPAPRFVGSITAIVNTTVTVKTDAGEQRMFDVPSSAIIKRISPGEKDLSKASAMEFGELAVGDRVLVKIDTTADAPTPQAAQIIAVKQEDLAQKQQKDREDWQRRGVAGLVKSVDASAGTIVLNTGAGATAKTVTIHTTKSTVLKRYAAGSVRFDQAQPAPMDAIQPGDQLRARGEKNSDGTEITADEVVSGSFRNIAGTISSIDAANKTIVVKDLATKKTVTVQIGTDAQMRRLPERMAQILAIRLKGGGAGFPGVGSGGPGSGGAGSGGGSSMQPGAGGGSPSGAAPSSGGAPQPRSWNGGSGAGPAGRAPGSGSGGGPGGPGGGMGAPGSGSGQGWGQGGGDPQQMLSRAPAIQLADLQKGEAVMLVSTEGKTDVTAITLLAGVEPLLESPAASQNLLSNWSMGSGGGGEAGGGGPQ